MMAFIELFKVQNVFYQCMFQICQLLKMNTSTSSGTGLVAVLKKKMLDTKEEVEKVKEQIQDMNSKMQVLN